MQLYNLNDRKNVSNFENALYGGVSRNGGLYVPVNLPALKVEEINKLEGYDFKSIAFEVLNKLIGDEIPKKDLRLIVDKSFNFDLPIINVGNFKVMELFHGPTMAFKDFAARFLAHCFDYFAAKNNKPINILVATSGDTGGAIANAFGELKNTKVFILFPKGRVSEIQYDQITKTKSNINALEIEGSFDDCQYLVKQALIDEKLSINRSTANSINIGRLLPQITYYTYAKCVVGDYQAVIPTGNLGNATAALMANRMNIGPERITLATNLNDTMFRYYKSGIYKPMISIETISNAMDVGSPNNFVRFNEFLNSNINLFKELIDVYRVSDLETIHTIKKVYKKYNYLLDPHTAVAWYAAEQSSSHRSKIIVSTASPVKFAKEIESLTGIKSVNNSENYKINSLKTKKTNLSKNYHDFSSYLRSNAI